MATILYLTKYALTKGIIEVKEEQLDKRYLNENSVKLVGYFDHFHFGKDVFKTREEAKKVAEQMRDKKLESVKKQLKKLEKMTF